MHVASLEDPDGKANHRDIPTVDASIRDHVNSILMPKNGRGNVISANITPRGQAPGQFIISLRNTVIVSIAVKVGRQQTRQTQVRHTHGKIIANELQQKVFTYAWRPIMILMRERCDKSLDRSVLFPGSEMSGGLFTQAVEYTKDWEKGKKLLVHVGNTVGRMLIERESERFAQFFHQGAVHKLGSQFDGIVRDAPVSHRANTPARLCVSFQANRINAQASRRFQGRDTSYSAANDEKIRFRSQLAGCTHRRSSGISSIGPLFPRLQDTVCWPS